MYIYIYIYMYIGHFQFGDSLPTSASAKYENARLYIFHACKLEDSFSDPPLPPKMSACGRILDPGVGILAKVLSFQEFPKKSVSKMKHLGTLGPASCTERRCASCWHSHLSRWNIFWKIDQQVQKPILRHPQENSQNSEMDTPEGETPQTERAYNHFSVYI